MTARSPAFSTASIMGWIMVCTIHAGCAVALARTTTAAQVAPERDGAVVSGTPTLRQTLPPDLPLDADGIPMRPLSDDELFRLLIALSSHNEPAAMLLAACHASGRPYGHPGWRDCIVSR